jgi:2-dehydropantoate 2-reductase
MQQQILFKLTIVGPGAMGCLLATTLYKHNYFVSLLDYKPDRAKRLNKSGIQVTSSESKETWTAFPNVTTKPESFGVQDCVIVLVKAMQTADAVEHIRPLIGPKTLIVTLQNGLGHEAALSKIAKSRQIALGVTSQGATLLNEGRIRHSGSGPTNLGLVTTDAEAETKLMTLAALLNNSGWPCQVVKNIYTHIWRKLIINVGINAITALCGLTNGEVLQYKESVRLQELAVYEAWNVSLKKNIALNLSLQETYDMVNLVCRKTSENKSSMLQDRIKKRLTEIDYINGAIISIGKELGIATPVNEVLTLLVHLNSRLGWKIPGL